MKVEDFVKYLFVYDHEAPITPELTEMYKELLTKREGPRRMESCMVEFVSYKNEALDEMLTHVEKYIDCEVVQKVLKEKKIFQCVHSCWINFEKKLEFIYQQLYQANNIQRNSDLIIGNEARRTLSAELFVDNVVDCQDVREKLKLKAEDCENLDQQEVKCFKLVCDKLRSFRFDRHIAELHAFLEKSLPKNV